MPLPVSDPTAGADWLCEVGGCRHPKEKLRINYDWVSPMETVANDEVA